MLKLFGIDFECLHTLFQSIITIISSNYSHFSFIYVAFGAIFLIKLGLHPMALYE